MSRIDLFLDAPPNVVENWSVLPADAIADEMSDSDLGDKRLDDRNGQLARMVAESPSQEFPEAAKGEAELEATYRFWRHPSTGFGPVIEPHLDETASRVKNQGRPMLAVHDTTAFQFADTGRPGLGSVGNSPDIGFFGHLTLAVRATGPKLPDGLLAGQLWRREPDGDVDWPDEKDCLETKPDESAKWLEGVEQTETRVDPGDIIHLMDRGADAYSRLAAMATDPERRFVMRANQNRRVDDEASDKDSPKLEDALHQAPTFAERTIELSSRDQTGRPPGAKDVHPSRTAREATVEIRARKLEIRRPVHSSDKSLPETIEVGVVWVREIDCPEEAEPVDWRLYTSEPIEKAEQVEQVVDWYQRRWVIEEYFGALKGACRVEERQLESAATLTTALGMMAVAAWRLLALRTLTQHAPDRPADVLFRASQLAVMVESSKTDLKEADGTTLKEALLAVAAMGGYLQRNGPPGWLVLHRGYGTLRTQELAWRDGRRRGQREATREAIEMLKQMADGSDDPTELVESLEDQLPDIADDL